MKILVINAGSSSLKFQFIDMDGEILLAKGICDRIGIDESVLKYCKNGNEELVFNKEMRNHAEAINIVIEALMNPKYGVIKDVSEIAGVGHRVLHGGEKFHDPVVINGKVMDVIRECIPLGPLHNPANLMGIEGCRDAMPDTIMVGVFDTGFHQTMPKYAYIYPLPYSVYEKYGIRKYGFHGTSHMYVTKRAAKMLNKPISELKLISCHLGNGSSICGVEYGKCVDTSMGFTPLDGLEMGSRCGSIDPAVVTFLMDKEGFSPSEMMNYMNKKSGLLGVSGISSDFRDVQAAAKEGNNRALLSIEILSYGVKKFIGAYAAAMNGIDAIILTGGIGENDMAIRRRITENMDFLGIEIDNEKNKSRGIEIDISTDEARVRTLVVPTNEELAIARETLNLIK
ncbi:MAG: acetate kinase [Clostridia bacterium]|jgi:acetate kinase